MTEITVDWLRRTSEVLFRHLEETRGPQVRLDRDYYWSIDSDQSYDLTKDPTDFSIGSLVDEAGFVRSMVDSDTVVNYGLVWFGELLRAVGVQSEG